MIAQELEENIQYTFKDAFNRNLKYVTVEHLLLVLLGSKEVKRLTRNVDSDSEQLLDLLEQFLAKRVPRNAGANQPSRTVGFKRVLEKAINYTKDRQRPAVTAIDVLIAIYSEPESFAAQFMNHCGLTKAKIDVWQRNEARRLTRERRTGSASRGGDDEALTTNLTQLAIDGQIDKPYTRQDIVDAMLRVLCRKYKSNPVLVGEPGVGKTAIVHTLAHLSANPSALPVSLRDLQVHEVNVASLVAGTKYRGEFEARMKKLVQAQAEQPQSVLFIDEIHTIIGAGSVSGGSLDAANILKPALANGSLRCIGATTHAEYGNVFVGDAGLSRRFQKIEVPEPSHEEAVAILSEFQPRLERHHQIKFQPGTLQDAVRLADRFISSRVLPDKAIDLLDETAAAAVLAGSPHKISTKELNQTVARISGMPPLAIRRDERTSLRNLRRTLARHVFGQDEAVTELAQAVRRARLGITPPTRPIGSFLFAGPTGVGKTETAKALAEALGVNLLRFDMSEHMERHSVSRLIGAPPGYVGYEQRGQLTDQISRHPHSVLLLDEIEKAHPDIFNILLQVMDHGALTDNTGARADFRHVTLIMTTNAGAETWDQAPLGFSDVAAGGDELIAIKRLFSPEFRNRLDHIIRFTPLDHKTSRKVVERELRLLGARIAKERNYTIQVSKDLIELLLTQGFSRSFGARPLQREISHTIVDAIVDEETRAKIPAGTTLLLDNIAGKVIITRTNKPN